jgi:hypothetical protein
MSQTGGKRKEEKAGKRMREYFTAFFFIIKTSG